MIEVIRRWARRSFSHPQALALIVVLTLGASTIIFLGHILMPVLASIVLAYFMHGFVLLLNRIKISNQLSFWLTYLLFLTIYVLAFLLLLPMVWKQTSSLFLELPDMAHKFNILISQFINDHASFFVSTNKQDLVLGFSKEFQVNAKSILSASLSSIPGVISWIVYLILVPLLVFFFLKDHKLMLSWLASFLPERREVLLQVWCEMDEQIGNYVRGKVIEIMIVGFITYLNFIFFDLHYAILLASLVGLSVVIPYVGAAVITIPVILVAYVQWGISAQFIYLVLTYLTIQGFDGNLLVPLLFYEAVNLHPVAIIISILFFGSFWGFWGVFFAIPLATLIKAIINAWPTNESWVV